jgi:hypothetical protein
MLTGKGMWIWNIWDCEKGNPAAIAAKAKAGGFSHVLIKVSDGQVRHNVVKGVDTVPPVVEALRAQGISVWAWQYVYGNNPVAEAQQAVNRLLSLPGFDGFVINAEMEYKKRPTEAKVYCDAVRRSIHLPIALSSFRFPKLHPEFPWQVFLSRVDINMPQVYWMGATNSAAQLVRSVTEFRSMMPDLPIIPTGASFHQDGWTSKPAEIVAFADKAKEMGFDTINFWEWANAVRYGLWDTVAALWRDGAPVEKPEEPEPVENGSMRLQVLVDVLNVRTGPGINFPDVGDLHRGDTVEISAVSGAECWVRIGQNPDRWACVQRGGTKFMGGV